MKYLSAQSSGYPPSPLSSPLQSSSQNSLGAASLASHLLLLLLRYTFAWIKPTLLLWSGVVFPTLSRIHFCDEGINQEISLISQSTHFDKKITIFDNDLSIIRWSFGFHHAWIEIPRCLLGHSLKENCPSWDFQLLITSAQITSNWWMSIVKLRGLCFHLSTSTYLNVFHNPIHNFISDHIIQICVGSVYSFHMKGKLVWLVVICRVFRNRVNIKISHMILIT